MKIVQLCPYAMERPGGVQRHVRDLSEWLVMNGHGVRIIAPPASGNSAARYGNLIEIGRARNLGVHGTSFEVSRASGRNVTTLTRELRDWGAEIVHAHTPWTPMLVGQMVRALKLPLVTTIHATLPKSGANGIVNRYIRWSARRWLNRSDNVIVPSSSPIPMLQGLVEGLDPIILPPAINLSDWRNPRHPKTRNAFLFFGRLEARKGVDILLQAWPIIRSALPDASLTIAGDGPMKARVADTKLDGMTYLCRQSRAEMILLMQKAEFFLAPALYGESYGLVLDEAMAAETVPIAANNSGYKTVLADRPELLVEAGDPRALAQRAIELAGDPVALANHRAWAKERSRTSDVTAIGPEYVRVFQTCLK